MFGRFVIRDMFFGWLVISLFCLFVFVCLLAFFACLLACLLACLFVCLFVCSFVQLVVNGCFGSRWFGFLGFPKMKGIVSWARAPDSNPKPPGPKSTINQ